MAGAPGVGKTEFSKSFIEVYHTVKVDNYVKIPYTKEELLKVLP